MILSSKTNTLGFAADHDAAVPYLERSREYYLAMGYPRPYVWAHLEEVAFTPLGKPLSQTSVTIITTASPIEPCKGDQGANAAMNPAAAFGKVYSAPSKDAPVLGISHLHYDRGHTDAADSGAFMPLAALSAAEATGRIGALSPRFHGVPTRYSHRQTLNRDGPELLARLREDSAGAAILIAI